MADPRLDYTRQLDARRASLAASDARHIREGNLRLAIVVAGVAAMYGVFGRGLFPSWWLLAFVAAFVWASGRLDGTERVRARLRRAVAFYERALARLDGRWTTAAAETGTRFLDDTHLYVRDLDVFGEASLFQRLNGARTRIGEEMLAMWLKTPASPSVVRERQVAVTELTPRTDLREDLALLGEDARVGVNAQALAAWGERPSRLNGSSVPIWVWPLSAAGALAAIGLILWMVAAVGWLRLGDDLFSALQAYVLTLLPICAVVVWRFRARNAGIFVEVDDAARDLGLLSGILSRLETERFESAALVALQRRLEVEGEPPSRRIARLHALMNLVDSREHTLVRIIGPLLLWDVHLVYAIERWRHVSGPALRRWLDAVGEIEALLSLSAYRYEHPDDEFADLSEGPARFDGEGLGHPLLSDAVAVRNDVHLTGDLQVLVVSGSNMSGKSTLLRTVGLNAVLAQAGAPVRARRLRLTPLDVGASIHVADSLQSGVSRFYAEITRLGEIVRRAGEAPVFFLIDELLHGTNSHDRRIGAEAIIRALVAHGAIGLVTTHDLALVHVADALGPRGANVHFQDVLEDGRMRFDYRMRPGVVQKSNALELMRSVGLDV